MTVTNTDNKDIFVGDDATLIFAYTFRIFFASDLEVTIQDTSVIPQTEILLVLNTDYTVSDVGNPAGGNVTLLLTGQLSAPPTTTDNITILREMPLTQNLDLIENDDFPSQSQEDAFDKLTFITQQLQEQVSRSVNIPANITGVNVDLPAPVADQFIGWNSSADALVNLPDPSVAAQAAADAAAISAAAALVSENNAATSEGNAATSESNASTSETNASASAALALASQNCAEDWATEIEDTPIGVPCGGDGSTTFSALHYAAKAAASASALGLPIPSFPANEGEILVARVAAFPLSYAFEAQGVGTLVDDFTIKNVGGVIEVADNLVNIIVFNLMSVIALQQLTLGDLTDGSFDTYTDELGVDLGASADQVFESGTASYRTPIPSTINAETLKLLFNELNGSLEIADQSVEGHIITQVGNATLSPNHFQFGVSSLYTRIGGGLSTPASADFDFGTTGDFSIDLWFREEEATTVAQRFYFKRTGSGSRELEFLILSAAGGRNFRFATNDSSGSPLTTAQRANDNEWHHIYAERLNSGTELAVYMDDFQIGHVVTTAQNVDSSGALGIMSDGNGNAVFNGWSDDFRVSDVRRFGTNPLDRPFLHLTLDDDLASTAVIDFGSGGNNGVTVGGNTETFHADGKVRFGFNFDGSSDHITVNSAVAGIASDTTGTICAWLNPNAIGSQESFFTLTDNTDTNNFLLCRIIGSGNVSIATNSGGSPAFTFQTNDSIAANVWTHFALVQNGTVPVIYINGVLAGVTFSVNTDLTAWLTDFSGIDRLTVGAREETGAFNTRWDGRLDDVRYYSNVALTQTEIESIRVAGVAGIYGLGDGYTVPTVAHTDDGNTMLLLPFNNATQGQDLIDISTGGANSPRIVSGNDKGDGVTGKFGNACFQTSSLVGADFLTIPSSSDFNDMAASLVGDYTMGLWVRNNIDTTLLQGFDNNYLISQDVDASNVMFFGSFQDCIIRSAGRGCFCY